VVLTNAGGTAATRCDGSAPEERFDFGGQTVAGAALGEDQGRIGGVGLDLQPQAADLHVDRPVVHLGLMQGATSTAIGPATGHAAALGLIDSEVALEALRVDPGSFDAIITDESMPGLSGIQLTQGAHRIVAATPVLLVSGHGGALIARRAAEAGVSHVLAKPLQRVDLARAMASALAR
jgi:CheY-like chemotaxis protein